MRKGRPMKAISFVPRLLYLSASGSGFMDLLGGSWVVISMTICPLIWVITIVTLLITPLITTHEPPSTVWDSGFRASALTLRQTQARFLVVNRRW